MGAVSAVATIGPMQARAIYRENVADRGIDVRACIGPMQASASAHVPVKENLEVRARIGPMQGSASANVFVFGERQSYLRIGNGDKLRGCRVFAKGPGLLTMVGSRESRRVVCMDLESPRSLTIVNASAQLPGEVESIATNDDYVFVFCAERVSRTRHLVVLENRKELGVVHTVELDNNEDATWLALNREAGVFAHPAGRARVHVRRSAPPFEFIDSAPIVNNSERGLWTRAVTEEASSSVLVNRRHILYAFSQEAAECSGTLYETIDEEAAPASATERLRPWCVLPLKDATDVRQQSVGVTELVSGAAVTPREPVKPVFEGVIPDGKDRFLAVFGYDNVNPHIVDQPQVDSFTQNRWVQGGTAERNALLPTLFLPGRINAAVVLRVQAGEALEWLVDTQAGGGSAEVDYSQVVDPLSIDTDFIRGFFPAALKYRFPDSASVEQLSRTRLEATRFNSAGVVFADGGIIRHTQEQNDDLDVEHWQQRNNAARVAGGFVQLHADNASVSKQYQALLDREVARGVLFNVPPGQIDVSENFELPPEAVQVDEIGFSSRLAVDHEDRYVYWGCDDYIDSEGAAVGRVHRMRVVSSVPFKLEYEFSIEAPFHEPLWAPTRVDGHLFGRGLVVTPDASTVFIGGIRSPGIAVYRADENGATYSHTIFTRVNTRSALNRIRDMQIGKLPDGTDVIFVGVSNNLNKTETAEMWALTTTDNWLTVTETLLEAIAGENRNPFDIRADIKGGQAVAAMNNQGGNQSLTIFRTVDNWQTDAGVRKHFFPSAGRGWVAQPSRDGMLVAASHFFEDRVNLYRYNTLTEQYEHFDILEPPASAFRLPLSFSFNGVLWSGSSDRLLVLDSRDSTPELPGLMHVFGRHGDKFGWLGAYEVEAIEGVDEPGTLTQTDVFMYPNRISVSGGGSIVGVTIPEAP